MALDVGTSLGPDGRVAAPSTRLASSDTIHAVLSTQGPAKLDLTARWTRPLEGGGRVVIDERTKTLSSDGPALTAFQITKPGGWPAGSYRVEISGSDSVLASKEFVVE